MGRAEMQTNYKNKNRGYQQLRVWQDAIDYYVLTCRIFRCFQFELRRIGSQAMASGDSVHRNIAEGYCRRSLREYLQFLNIAPAHWVNRYRDSTLIAKLSSSAKPILNSLNDLSFKLENGPLKLVERLEMKQETGDWIDSLIIKESNV